MANKSVYLVRRCKTPEGWKRYPVMMSGNGKVKENAVTVGGVQATYPVGHYELSSYAGSKRVWTKVDGNASDALAALKVAQKKANAVAVADDADIEVVIDPKRVALKSEATKFIEAALSRGSKVAAKIYRRSLNEFLAGCSRKYADELTNDDILKFHGKMRGRGLSDRTVHNRHMHVRSFLLTLGFNAEEVKTIAGKRSPKYEKTMPEIYEPADLKAFFGSLESAYDRILFDVLLKTGLRDREAQHLEWKDIIHSRLVLQVRSKPRYRHKIKDAEEREMPLTRGLSRELQLYREEHPKHRLVFGKRGGMEDAPDGHLIRRLKRLVKKAGLNCGVCSACVDRGECEDWFLHKFRATYITTLLRNGMDIRSVMKLSGHSDLASVMRYLRPAEGAEVQERVNAIKWR